MIDTVWVALRLVIAAVLVAAVIGKVRDPRRFADDIGRYEIVPRRFRMLVAIGLISLEGLAAGLTLVGEVAGVGLALGLFLLFAVAVLTALRAGRAIPCGCFGGDEVVSRRALVRLGLLVAACGVALAAVAGDPVRWIGGLDGALTLTAAVGLLVLGRLLLLLPDVLAATGHGATPESGT